MSRQSDDNLKNWEQHNFGRGLVKNAPHEDIPDTSVAGLVNAHCYDTEIQPRLASWLWSELQPPIWRDDCNNDEDTYTMEKVDDIVTCNDDIFTQGFVSRHIAWPTDDGYYHDEIIEYLSGDQVRVSLSGNRNSTSGCYIHGRLNTNGFHKRMKRKIWQWGKRIYTSPISYSRWNECLCVSRRMPSNVISDYDDVDDYSMLGNSNGIFKLSFYDNVRILWRANGPIPDVLLEGRTRRRVHKKRYDYLYSMCRLGGYGLRSRTTVGATLLQQSGTTRLNLEVTPNRDYTTYWTEKPIGNNDTASQTGCRLICARLSDTNRDPGYYRTIAAPGASFKFTHNDDAAEFLVDMSTTGENVQNMAEVATALQKSINTLFPWIQVEYTDNDHFVFTTGEESNSTISYLGAGTSGTDVSSIIKGTEEDSATIDDDWPPTSPNQVGILYIPRDQGNYEWHWSHYSLWRSTDISENGADPRTTDNKVELPPNKITWCGDYRVAGAFYASMSNNIVTAEIGSFEKADEGTPLRFEDGEVYTIIEYISIRQVRVGSEYYEGGNKALQACAIGGGRVMRASQSGNIVTLETELNDDVFSNTECDERKTIYWSTDYSSIIVRVLSGNRVQVHDSVTRETQGITLDPTCRVITDITTDKTLRNRMDEKHIGLLNMRYKEAMPNCNILRIVPGFMITARRGDSLIHYCDMPSDAKYNAGYYLQTRQIMDKIEGTINFIKKAPNYFLVWCNNSLWGGPTNNPDIKDLPEFGEWYGVLHADIVDEYIGAVDWGSIEEIDYGTFELVCQDMSVRQLVNKKYGEDLTFDRDTEQDIIAKDFKECWNLGASAYGRTLGHVFWMTAK